MKQWFYANNFYLKNPISYKLNSGFLDSGFRFVFELGKIFLVRAGLMKPIFNERLFERPFIFNNLDNGKKLKILDLGCGDSIFSVEMKALGHEVWAADPKNYPYKKYVKFIRGDFLKQASKFPKNHFDVITIVSAIEHFGLEWSLGEKISSFEDNRKDIEAIRICKDLLKPNGKIILTIPYGKKMLFDNERVYDEKELAKLMNGFKLKKKEIVKAQNEILNEPTHHPSILMAVYEK